MGLTVPVLFRRYTELCENGGVKFIDFNIDANFSNCVDGFVILEISKIKQMYKTRYKFEEDNISDEIFINQAGQLILTNSHKTTADKA
ncbi:hypothetical protein SDC9_138130 [bioreactor metagenome]|uniref:Uncharacterized protein n=1 Tax=bioreactor metagenome TaxID=1076179 RepID=A0A645DP36_9ZZZZ